MNVSVVGIAIIAILLIFFIIGWKNGLIKAIFDLLSFFIVVAFTWALYPSVSQLLMQTPLYTIINNWADMSIKDNVIFTKTLPDFFNDLPLFVKNSIYITSKISENSFLASAADALAVLTINVISIILLFILLTVLTKLIKKYAKYINKIILVGFFNRVLGGLLGLIQGVLVSYFIIMIISYFPTTEIYDFVAKDMDKSYVCKIMYEDLNVLGLKPTYPVIRGE